MTQVKDIQDILTPSPFPAKPRFPLPYQIFFLPTTSQPYPSTDLAQPAVFLPPRLGPATTTPLPTTPPTQ